MGISADGKELWRYKKLRSTVANIPTPIALGDQVFTLTGYAQGGAALLTLTRSGGGVSMKEDYFVGEFKNKHGGVVIVGDYVYGDLADQGNIACMEWKTGKIKWTRGESKGKRTGRGSASITAADGHLYIRYSDGTVVLAPASPDGYEEVGSFKIPGSSTNSWAHPVVIDGKLYLREKDNLFCYDVKGK